jgi:hypothetical protein
MQELPNGAYKAKDGEVLSLDIKSTGAPTLFGVNYSLGGHGSPIPEGKPFPITLKKSDAVGGSDIPGAKSTVLTLAFSFSTPTGGKYHYTITGDAADPPISADATQAGAIPTVDNFIIHIV